MLIMFNMLKKIWSEKNEGNILIIQYLQALLTIAMQEVALTSVPMTMIQKITSVPVLQHCSCQTMKGRGVNWESLGFQSHFFCKVGISYNCLF